MGWIDSHCHLDFDEFSEEHDLTQRLITAGCDHILVPAISANKFKRLQKFKSRSNRLNESFVYIALGLHPYFLKQHEFEDLSLLEALLENEPPLAVGEIGLDFLLDTLSHESQVQFFESQVRLAKKYQLPIIVHCRKAHDQLCSILKRLQFSQGGIIHAFSGSTQQAQNYIQLGFVLGLGGALTYDRAKAMHKMIKLLPESAYVLETDSPDMAPSFAKGQVNTPFNIPQIAQHISELRGETVTQIFKASSQNFKRVMKLS